MVTITNTLQTLTPLIYTPVVGEACLKWSEIYQQPEGMFHVQKMRQFHTTAEITLFQLFCPACKCSS